MDARRAAARLPRGQVSLHSSVACASRAAPGLQTCLSPWVIYVFSIVVETFLFVFSSPCPFPFCFGLSLFGLMLWGRF